MIKSAFIHVGVLVSLLAVAVTLVWFGFFLLDWPLFPTSMNHTTWQPDWSVSVRLLWDSALIALFGVQHSVMARTSFKRWLQNWVDYRLERMVYMAASAFVVWVLLQFWQSVDSVVWALDAFAGVFYVAFVGGAVVAVWATMSIDGSELAGLRQWRAYRQQRDWTGLSFQQPAIYRWVRHPMQLGVLIMVWMTPTLTLGHALFALGMTSYVLVGIHFEERGLLHTFGEDYRRYQQQVPMLFPGLRLPS